jgi:hypothetical protein
MSRISFGEFGNFLAPQTFSSAGGVATVILGQWWFDFTRLNGTGNINVFLGVEGETDGNGTGNFGAFILVNGDPVLANLFGAIVPVSTALVANINAFHGYNGNATIANPNAKMQILIAAQPQKAGVPDTTISWRSAFVRISEV